MWRDSVTISVIVPIFHGKKYIPEIITMLERNLLCKVTDFEIELIFVNDSPNEVIHEDKLLSNSIVKLLLIVNKENKGIHYSRIQGLKKAKGEYVLFLDQDDKITDDFFESQLRHIGKKDIVVANGTAQYPSYEKLLYRYRIMQWTVKHIWFYIQFDNRIISPGQCLIRRTSIPTLWTTQILQQNGADDYFLWLVMLSLKKHFEINREILYTHKYTSANASENKEEMRSSVQEMLTIIETLPECNVAKNIRKRIQRANSKRKYKLFISIIESINMKGTNS